MATLTVDRIERISGTLKQDAEKHAIPRCVYKLQRYFRAQEREFLEYFEQQINKTGLPSITDSLKKFVKRFDWEAKPFDMTKILLNVTTDVAPFAIKHAKRNILNIMNYQRQWMKQFTKCYVLTMKGMHEFHFKDTTFDYVNSDEFAEDAMSYIDKQNERVSGNYLYQVSKTIDKTTASRVYDELKVGVDELENMTQLRDRVQSVFDECSQSRAMCIARTETMRSFDNSTLQAYQMAEIEEVQWSAASDACDDCDDEDGTIYDVESEDEMPLHPNCRCSWLPVVNNNPILEVPGGYEGELDFEDLVNQELERQANAEIIKEINMSERGHFTGQDAANPRQALIDSARENGINVSMDEAKEQVKAVREFTEMSYRNVREVQKYALENGWDKVESSGLFKSYDINLAKNVEKFIANSPNYIDSPIYRCIAYDSTNISEARQIVLDNLLSSESGSIINMGGASSWSSEALQAVQFGNFKNENEMFMFVLENGSSRSASLMHVSTVGGEKEVAVSMFQNFEIVSKEFGSAKDILKLDPSTFSPDNISLVSRDRWIIHLKEVKP